ncbi:MAG: FecR family protein [Pseudomonadota bacterium]
MNRMSRALRYLASAIFVSLVCVGPVAAQPVGAGCVLDQAAFAGRQVLRCEGGLTITVESGAQYSLADRDGNGKADTARLSGRALLIDAPKGSLGKAGFQVTTPQAIAAVRGTKWAVDADGSKTSVFVARGRVSVRRPESGRAVVLGAGDGVDVEAGTGPLTVKRWAPARVQALMARFGQ